MEIRNNIYDLLTDNIDDIKIAEEIYNKVDDLEKSIRDDYRHEIKKLKDQITHFENKLDYEETQNKLLKNVIQHFSVFRCALNKIVHDYWTIYEHEINNLDYNKLINNYNSRKKTDNDGFKYAIARINNKCDGLSIELCKLYLLLNDSFHPKIKPINVIEESINKMKDLVSNNSLPDYYLQIGLNKEILIDFENIIKIHSQLFI